MPKDVSKIQEAEVVETPAETAIKQIAVLAKTVGELGEELRGKMKELEKDQEQLNKNQQKLVDHVNGWIQSIEGIDQTAFIATYVAVNNGLGDKITKEKVKKTHEFIQDSFKKLESYRDILMKEVEKNKKKIEANMKKEAKKAKKATGNQGGAKKSKSK